MAEQLVGVLGAEGGLEFALLSTGARVGPDDRGTHGLAVAVQQHGAHHLTAHDETGHLGGGRAGALQQLAGGGDHGIPPVLRLLLGDAAGREVRRVRHGHGCDQPPVVVVQGRLVAGGAEIVRDDHCSSLSWVSSFGFEMFCSIPVITSCCNDK
ncbi:hypothetical protein QF046_002700 [Microbacterium sp. W4I4]|nr:hypothetical protein [Microbacterium sp. W4I4]